MATITLHVVQAFYADPEGNLIPGEPKSFPSAAAAKQAAKALSREASGVISWSRALDPEIGEYGEPTVLVETGLVPAEFE
jgi:hypothetical protein